MNRPAAQVASEQTFLNEPIGNCPDPANFVAYSPKINLGVLELFEIEIALFTASLFETIQPIE